MLNSGYSNRIEILKDAILFLAILAYAGGAAAADTARLALWVTDPVSATSGIQCNLQASPAYAGKLPTTLPALTERDVVVWNWSNERWTLDPARFVGIESAQHLQTRCIQLAIDGKLVSSGIVLSEHSARLTGFPTLVVINHNKTLTLELLSGNHGTHMRLLHAEALDAVLRQK